MILSDKEIDTIIKSIEGMNNVDIKDEVFRQKILEYGSNVEGVMRLLNDIFDETPSLEDFLHETHETE